MATFPLVTEPWIPMRCQDGSTRDVNLRTALCDAQQFREIRDPIPTVEFGLYRLLVALVHDIFQPEVTEDLGELLDAGAFDEGKIDRYFAEHADRFDLFHPQYPFLQTGGMEHEEAKPLSGLVPLIPSGTNALHFYHAHESEFGVCPAAAARLLTAIAPFMTAGGAGLSPSINGAPPWYVLLTGQSLFHTLCLNTSVIPHNTYNERNRPAWRRGEPVKAARYKQASLLEALTWQPRRIQLIPGGPGHCALTNIDTPVRVHTMRFTAGAACDFSWEDPNVPYKITEKGQMVQRPQEEKALWRDTGPLLLLQKDDYVSGKRKLLFERPRLVSQLEILIDEKVLPRDTIGIVKVYGMRTDMKMKVFEWQCEALQLPVKLLGRKWACAEAQKAMEQADAVGYQLKQAVKHVYPRDGASNKAAFETLVAHAQRQYWQALRGTYDNLLLQLAYMPTEADVHEAARAACRDWWETQVTKTGKGALESAIRDLDTDAEAMRRQVEAQQQFARNTWLAFHTKDEMTTRRTTAKT